MKNEFQKRIVTSIFLLSLISLCLYLGDFAILIAFIIVSYISFDEFACLLARIYKHNFLRNCLNGFYFFVIFLFSAWSLTTLNIYDFIFVISICIFSDVGGYIVGKTIKGPKLTKISPNKTVSGSIGSIVFSFLPLILLNYFLPNIFLNLEKSLLFCIEISVVCQLGDLFISFFKRKAKVKDTGKILPGHGGLLDRIDGIIFALPYVSFLQFGLEHWKYYINLLFN